MSEDENKVHDDDFKKYFPSSSILFWIAWCLKFRSAD